MLACWQCASCTEAPSTGLRKYHRRERTEERRNEHSHVDFLNLIIDTGMEGWRPYRRKDIHIILLCLKEYKVADSFRSLPVVHPWRVYNVHYSSINMSKNRIDNYLDKATASLSVAIWVVAWMAILLKKTCQREQNYLLDQYKQSISQQSIQPVKWIARLESHTQLSCDSVPLPDCRLSCKVVVYLRSVNGWR